MLGFVLYIHVFVCILQFIKISQSIYKSENIRRILNLDGITSVIHEIQKDVARKRKQI